MTLVDRSLRRQLTAAMALAMALALLLSGTALAQTSSDAVAAVAIDDTCNDVPEDNFDDVPETYEFDDEIECLKAYDITKGVGDGSRYEPQQFVPRWQMALFIYRLADDVVAEQRDDVTLPNPDGNTPFNDLGGLNDQEAINAIDALNEMGVVEGKTSTTYEPFTKISRDQMASFINRLQDYFADQSGDADAFAEGEDSFPDDDGNVHEDNINSLANVGIVQGKATGDYDPRGKVTRGQMSAFIIRYLEVNVDAGFIDSLYPRDDDDDDDMPNNAELTVTPTDAVTLDADESRTYTASGLTGDSYRITLVNTDGYSIDDDGNAVFADDDDSGTADAGDLEADITSVNGEDTGADDDTDVQTVPDPDDATDVVAPDADGEITFTVTGDGVSESLVPVVYVNGGDSTFLEVDEDGLPVEDFGVGGLITFEGVEEVTNETIVVTPDDAATIELSDPDDSTDDREYTASGLDADTEYRVTLVDADNVTMNGGTVSFTEDGSTGLAAAGDLDADLTIVNGNPSPNPADAQTIGGIMPVDGEIVFEVDGESSESLFPVVYVDGGANTRLEIDEDGLPTEDFGVGGQLTFLAEEADAGVLGADADITFVDTDADLFVADDGTGEATYYYDDNDEFFVSNADGTTAIAPNDATMTVFEEELSEGDVLEAGSEYASDESLPSTFLLNDISPEPPTIDNVTDDGGVDELDDVSGSSASFDITDLDEGVDTVTIYYQEDADDDDDTLIAFDEDDFDSETFDVGSDDDTTLVLDGLNLDTSYDAYASQTVDGDESDVSDGVEFTTDADEPDAPIITDSRVDETGGVTAGTLDFGDVIQLTFDEDMDESDVQTLWTFTVEDDDGAGTGDTFEIDCAGAEVTCVLSDTDTAGGDTDNLLTATIAGANTGFDVVGVTDIGTGDGDDTPNFPATITDTAAAVDDESGDEVDLDASTDVLIDGEGGLIADADNPTVTSAVFTTDAGANGTFGDAADVITVTYDEPVAVLVGDTFVIDTDGDATTAGDRETYNCIGAVAGANDVVCAPVGNTVVITSAALTGAQTVTTGTSTFDETTGFEDAAGNVDNGLPEVIAAP